MEPVPKLILLPACFFFSLVVAPVLSVDFRDGSVRTHVAKHLPKGQIATALLVVETLRD